MRRPLYKETAKGFVALMPSRPELMNVYGEIVAPSLALIQVAEFGVGIITKRLNLHQEQLALRAFL